MKNNRVRYGALGAAAAACICLQAAAQTAPRYVGVAAVAGVEHVYRDGPVPGAATIDGAGAGVAKRGGAFVVGGGVAALDCDADGLLDLVFAGGAGPTALYRNRTIVQAAAIQPIAFERIRDTSKSFDLRDEDYLGVTGVYAFHWDNDAEPDLFLMRFGRNRLLRGLGDCRFEDVSDAAGLPSEPGWTTAFAAHWEPDAATPTLAIGSYVDRSRPLARTGNCPPGYLLTPTEEGRYGPPALIEPAGCALSMLFVDWTGRGDVALRVSNDRQYADPGVGEQLFRLAPQKGSPPQPFGEDEGWTPAIIWGMGLAAADLDGDGAPEIAATSMADNRVEKLVEAAKPTYENIALGAAALSSRPYVGPDIRPSTSWHVAFEDLNNDGALDLWIVKGNVSDMPNFAALDPDSLLLGAPGSEGGVAPFVEVGFEAGLAQPGRGRGGAAVDLNNDGRLDLVVVQYDGPVQIYQSIPVHDAADGFVSVTLEQSGPNRGAVGAAIELETPDGRIQRRTVRVGGGHASGSAAPTHFGLGPATEARIRVRWPDGSYSDWRAVEAGARITVKRPALSQG